LGKIDCSEMANTKASKKDIRRIAKRTVQNNMVRTSLKTFIKKSRKATASGDVEATTTNLVTAVKALDKAAQNGVIHPNQAARRKSRIAKQAAAALKNPSTEPAAAAEKKAPAAKKAAAKPAAAKKAPAKK
jgi:small subunit ribosomal protein S20